MTNAKADREFLFTLDYILNKAEIREIDAFAAAIERRKRQFDGILDASFLFTPEEAAKKISESIYTSIDTSMNGIYHTLRNYAADILQKEAPELSKEQITRLVDSWIPQGGIVRSKIGRVSFAKKEAAEDVPADMLYEMVIQFVSYSLGEMPLETQQSLSAVMHDWIDSYWRRFPVSIKQEIKAFLHGTRTSGEFQYSVRELLGLV